MKRKTRPRKKVSEKEEFRRMEAQMLQDERGKKRGSAPVAPSPPPKRTRASKAPVGRIMPAASGTLWELICFLEEELEPAAPLLPSPPEARAPARRTYQEPSRRVQRLCCIRLPDASSSWSPKCSPSFEGVVGLEDCKRLLQNRVFLPAAMARSKRPVPRPQRALVLYGPQKAGKRTLIRKGCEEAGIAYLEAGPWLEDKALLDDLYAYANSVAPCVVHLRGMDAELNSHTYTRYMLEWMLERQAEKNARDCASAVWTVVGLVHHADPTLFWLAAEIGMSSAWTSFPSREQLANFCARRLEESFLALFPGRKVEYDRRASEAAVMVERAEALFLYRTAGSVSEFWDVYAGHVFSLVAGGDYAVFLDVYLTERTLETIIVREDSGEAMCYGTLPSTTNFHSYQ